MVRREIAESFDKRMQEHMLNSFQSGGQKYYFIFLCRIEVSH